MKVGIMQPYFFPYIGYFQLINAVDRYVIYDDVNYIKRGWINRNRILLNSSDYLLTIHLQGASQNKKINEIALGDNRNDVLKTIMQAYAKAPYYSTVFPLLEKIINYNTDSLSGFLINSLQLLSSYLDCQTEIVLSSSIAKDNLLKGTDKILSICEILGASDYYNAIGGKDLYSEEDFEIKNIKLRFLSSKLVPYKQFGNEFIPWLSIIDVLMFNNLSEIRKMLDEYELQ